MTTRALAHRLGVSAETERAHQLEIVRAQLCPGANDAEFDYFLAAARHLELDPLKGEICTVGRWNRQVGRVVHRPQITVEGRRTIADRTGRLTGIEGPWWCGPRDNQGQLVWLDVWPEEDAYPYAARVFVHRQGWVAPANGTAKWSEFAQRDKDGRITAMWQQYPSHMLAKCAESLALRRAFREVADAIAAVGGDGDLVADAVAITAPTTGPTSTPYAGGVTHTGDPDPDTDPDPEQARRDGLLAEVAALRDTLDDEQRAAVTARLLAEGRQPIPARADSADLERLLELAGTVTDWYQPDPAVDDDERPY